MTESSKNNEDVELLRFQKPERLIDKVANGSLDYVAGPFLPLQLDDIAEEIDQWMGIALVNDNSAYETGQAREDLMDFCSELQLLSEALYVIHQSNKTATADEWKEKLPNKLRKELDQLNQPALLTEEQISNPMLVIGAFCQQFTLCYCRAELWDLLEAVISYEGKKEVSKINLLLVYETIASVIEAAFMLSKSSISKSNLGLHKKRP